MIGEYAPTSKGVGAGNSDVIVDLRRCRPMLNLWVHKIWSCALTRHDALESWGPMCRVLYRPLTLQTSQMGISKS